jgi:hypothetical protein
MATGIDSDRAAAGQEPPRRTSAVTSALLCLCTSAALNAGETHATLNVSVTVPPISRMDIVSQSRTVQITAQDLRRGYLDLSEPTLLNVYSNAREGFALEVLPMSPVIKAIAVRGMGAEADLGAQGGRIIERWDHPQTSQLALTFRLALAPDTQPGIYPWPLHLAIGPVDDAP